MKKRLRFLAALIALGAAILAACGVRSGKAELTDTKAPAEVYGISVQPLATPGGFLGAPEPLVEDRSGEVESALPAIATSALYYTGSNPIAQDAPQGALRMILKNAEVRLLVTDTDIAIDRATQVVGDLGGYIISSRVWYQEYYGQNLKYATMTIGIPVEEFERALSRMRNLAMRVLDENAAGEDVTDQYVDLQSQLLNLEATRERIKSFLEQAQSVDEALRINQELAQIERQIEEIKGRINYLADRSAYSTITINFEPDFPVLTPTPTATPTATPTPRPWKPGDTYNHARRTVIYTYQGIADFLIWFFIVLVPILAPPVLLVWGIWRWLNRKPKS